MERLAVWYSGSSAHPRLSMNFLSMNNIIEESHAPSDYDFVPQNAIEIELCLRITNGKPALAHWIGGVETKFGPM